MKHVIKWMILDIKTHKMLGNNGKFYRKPNNTHLLLSKMKTFRTKEDAQMYIDNVLGAPDRYVLYCHQDEDTPYTPKQDVRPSISDPEHSVSLYDACRVNEYGRQYCVAAAILPDQVDQEWTFYLNYLRKYPEQRILLRPCPYKEKR